jgi:hypothetical protein
MRARLITFGEIDIDGDRYAHDVVIEAGRVRKRRKRDSKAYRERYGHTPLSIDERIPWSAGRLIVGTGVDGRLPVMPEVIEEAERRGVELIVTPTDEACEILAGMSTDDVSAIIHVTC